MVQKHLPESTGQPSTNRICVIRHKQVCIKLQISSAKLFDMVAKRQFPKPFILVPGGRAVGWLESDVDRYLLARKVASVQEAT